MKLEQALRVIAAKSSLKYADLAAGDASGLKLRMKYTALDSGAEGESGSPFPAAQLPDRRYLIASITKPIVAMTAVQLAAEGQLALNDAVRDHLPGFHSGPLAADYDPAFADSYVRPARHAAAEYGTARGLGKDSGFRGCHGGSDARLCGRHGLPIFEHGIRCSGRDY